MKIFARDDVRRRLRPVGRRLHLVLLKDDRALVVADRRSAELPLNIVIGSLGRLQLLREIPGERNSRALPDRNGPSAGLRLPLLGFQVLNFNAEIYAELSHFRLAP